MDNKVLVVNGLCKSYGRHKIFDNISFDVFKNEVFGILGKNGAGKTTLMEIMSGYKEADKGEIKLFDIPIRYYTKYPKLRRKLGFSFQENIEYLRVTVGELLEHFSVYYENAFDVDYLLDRLSLMSSKAQRITRLSGGQKHRLDIALAILGKADLIFLDEPTSGLDPQSRASFYNFIEELKSEGKTFVLTSHYLNEIERLADRVMFVREAGVDPIIGTVHMLYERYTIGVTVEYGVEKQLISLKISKKDLNQTLSSLLKEYPAGIPNLSIRRSSLEDLYENIVSK
jgi:ABC-2 type transport system ATP-binding protein